jgi:RNA polymerase sigma-70 factor (ECF subfamily)
MLAMPAMLPETLEPASARDASFRAQALPHLAAITRLARALVTQESDADDLVQETFLRAYRYWQSFQDGSDCLRWLSAICRNVARDHHRRGADNIVPLELVADPWIDARPHASARDAGLAEMYDQLDLGPAIRRAIDALPQSFREVVTLCDVEGLSYEETALNLNVPVGTVRSRLYRARRRLQESLTKFAVDAGFAAVGKRSSP